MRNEMQHCNVDTHCSGDYVTEYLTPTVVETEDISITVIVHPFTGEREERKEKREMRISRP
jgi:hypothetical protein